jgi:hypothetical protein
MGFPPVQSPARRARLLPPLLVLLAPAVAHAEPRPPPGHLPFLHLLVLALSLLMIKIPLLIRKRLWPHLPAWPFWVAGILLGIAFFAFLAPLIVLLGSMLFIGPRTM